MSITYVLASVVSVVVMAILGVAVNRAAHAMRRKGGKSGIL
jgi:hypothetical protein